MSSKIKNIIIFIVIAIVLILVYVFFLKPTPTTPNLTTTSETGVATNVVASNNIGNTDINSDFLSTLLNVKNIKLDDSIFADTAFNSLKDSSIELIQDGTQGRPNPFAPIGVDNTLVPNNGLIVNSLTGQTQNLPATVDTSGNLMFPDTNTLNSGTDTGNTTNTKLPITPTKGKTKTAN